MSFSEFQSRVSQARNEIVESNDEARRDRQRFSNVSRLQKQRLREVAQGDRDNDVRLRELDQLAGSTVSVAATSRKRYLDAVISAGDILREFDQFTDPVENIASLDDDCPILMLPLRLEARFKTIQRDNQTINQLWVRVFPDDIAINSFESDLSESEIRNTRSYWLARWKAGKNNIDGNRGAWRSLVSSHGPGRAYWLMQNYRPENLAEEQDKLQGEVILAIGTDTPLAAPEQDAARTYWEAVWRTDGDGVQLDTVWTNLVDQVGTDRAQTIVDDYKPANLSDLPPADFDRESATVRVEFVVFPTEDELDTKLQSWSQPPSVSILPERFVLLGFHSDEQDLGPHLGALIPPRLILGPDPSADEGEDFRLASDEDAVADASLHEGDLIFSENMKWMFDFDEAVAKGMGFKIDLTAEQAERGFDRLFVIGLKLSADKSTGKALFEGLIGQHQNSRKGFAILRQGTPTNNTEEDESGYSWRHDPDDSFDVCFGETSGMDDSRDWFDKPDGRWLAEMLGLDAQSLRTVENYYATDTCEAMAMQRALWPATLGHFLQSMMHPVLEAEETEKTREFFTRYVSGRGSLSVIRVGRQPYGILPATRFTSMKWFERDRRHHAVTEHIPSNNYIERLYRILMELDDIWSMLVNRVAYVGKSGDPHQILLDILGLHPDSVELQKRYANTVKQLHNIYNLFGYSHQGLFRYYPNTYAAASALLARHGYSISGKKPEPEILKKSFFNKAWLLHGHRIDKVPNSETMPIGNYTTDDKNYIQWLIEAAEESHDRLRQQQGFIDGKKPTALLYLLMHHALDLSYIDTSLKLYQSMGILARPEVKASYVEPDFIHVEENKPTESHWRYLYVSDSRITGSNTMLQAYIPQILNTSDEAKAFRETLSGMKKLEDVPTARLERLMMEHLDSVSYRFDAWIMGFMTAQLELMRGLSDEPSAEGEERPAPHQGIYLGAYGWLEDLRPENKSVEPVDLPAHLEEIFNPDGDLVSDSTNAGYVLAPSQNHAVTAAILRNGHLSREDPEDKEDLKIKLTSERVRLGLQIIEGIQGGQSLSALLGYKFERGLHDRTDAEVDEFIFDLRNEFPLASKRFKDTTPGTEDSEYESIEQIEARNVIDAVALLEHIENTGADRYPFGLSLPNANASQQDAINDEIRKLIEINDAVADLALAESVHQVVLGNYERASATLDTYSKGKSPPTPDVIKTPRSGIQLTHRVGLQFRAGQSFTIGDAGVTPRMVAEPAMQDWLQTVLPTLTDIECVATYTDSTTFNQTRTPVTMALLGLAHIDLLYMLDIDNEQAMTVLDDLVVNYVRSVLPSLREAPVSIAYTETLSSGKISVFAFSSLFASLRPLLLGSKTLLPTDVMLSNEAARADGSTVNLNTTRVNHVIRALSSIRTGSLATCIGNLEALVGAGDSTAIVAQIDTQMSQLTDILVTTVFYGVAQTGLGVMQQWEQSMYAALRAKIDELITRWTQRREKYLALRTEYLNEVAAGTLSEEELFVILSRAELNIASSSNRLSFVSHTDYFNDLDTVRLPAFEAMINTTLPAIQNTQDLSAIFTAIAALQLQIPNFDSIGLDIEKQLNAVKSFAGDLLVAAKNLDLEIQQRVAAATSYLANASAAADAVAKVDAVSNGAKSIFGDDFVVVPEFTVSSRQATEWQSAVDESEHTLRYLSTDLDMDFPVDDWLYGIARVREKMSHLENTVIHLEGFNSPDLSLTPSQFPYRTDDLWLGLKFPDKKPGTEEPFLIDEDKLLYTAVYSGTFNATEAQCGLLLDEWSEVIPSRDETLGLSFHYDQPNSEPPQTMLLLTPSEFTGHWRWEDVVFTLHETLDMARKRAVEPDHIDDTVMGRFLPSVVSLTGSQPLTAMLNLGINNLVNVTQVLDDE